MRYELQNGSLRATADTHGGELVSLRDGAGTEYIWGGDPAFWPGRNPVLFPIVGGLKNGSVRFGSRTVQMGRHGFARDCDFTVEEQGDSHILFTLRDSPETRAHYPFSFSLKILHRLLENGFSTTFTVENTGGEALPFCIGAHTAFRCPLSGDERFEDYELVFDQPEDTPSLLLSSAGTILPGAGEDILHGGSTLPLDYSLFSRLDTLIFDQPRSRGVSLLHRRSGRGVRLEFSGFPMVAFWTKENAPFLCLEPWHGCAALENESGAFEEKPHCVLLASGESKVLSYTVSILPPPL